MRSSQQDRIEGRLAPSSAPTPERWREIQRVLDGALDLAPESRVAFVTDACGTDAALCDQVVRLLNACARAERTNGVLASPAAAFAAPMLADLGMHNAERRVALGDALRAAVAGRYTIERELGHGGMATVFLARDLRHDRLVAVKVLARDLVAPSGAERFLQEIRVTARLSHPHVLPVHDSGEADGLLYYVMPYADGETLRARLTRDGALPLPDALRLLRELSDALTYAHGHGVVHCDLKPENILLSGGHAVVADFGIAKAIAAAALADASPQAGHAPAGVVLGTPAYMAPEQAMSNVAVDHRADLYALGVVGYELLLGIHPFLTSVPQALVMPHMTDSPPRLRDRRPEIPPGVASLVMQCLGSNPSERPASAAAVLAALEEATREKGVPSRGMRRRRAMWAGLAAVVALALGLAAITARMRRSLISTAVLSEREPLVVADFRVAGSDTVLGPVLAGAFREILQASRAISLLPASRVDAALQRMRLPAGTPIAATLSRELAQREGVRAVVEGDLVRLGAGYLVTVRLVTPGTGQEIASVHGTAARPERDLFPTLGRLGQKLLVRIGESLKDVRTDRPLDQMTTSSFEALRKYSEARWLTGTDLSRRQTLLREAIALDSMFAYAHLSLGPLLNDVGERDSAYARAYRLRDQLTDMERAAVTAFYWTYVGRDRRKAMDVYEAQIARDSTDWRAILNLGQKLISTREFARAESLTRRYQGTVARRGTANLAGAQIGQGRVAAADSTWMLVQRDFPRNALALLTSVDAATASLQFDSAASRAASWPAVVSSTDLMDRPFEKETSIARARGRLAAAGRLVAQRRATRAPLGPTRATLRASLDAVREDLWLRGKPRGALARLDALLKGHPFASLVTIDDKIDALDAAALYAASGRADQARMLFDTVMKVADSLTRRVTQSYRETALGEIALAENRPIQAMDRFRRSDVAGDGLPVSSCVVCILPHLARAAERAGWADSARFLWERYVSTPSLNRVETDSWFLALAYQRLIDLHNAAGDAAKAGEYGERLASLWRGADPELQPKVAAARRRLSVRRSAGG